MTQYQRAQARRSLARALALLDGREITVYRPVRDGSGLPTGTQTPVGVLYAARCPQHASADTLGLDMPGVLAGSASLPRILAVLQQGEAPRPGDLLEGAPILAVEEHLGILDLRLGGEEA